MKLAVAGFVCVALADAELKPDTIRAFDRYISEAQPRLTRVREIREREVERIGAGKAEVPGGLIHDWVGAVFIPGTTLEKTLVLVRDYERHKQIYKPEVIDSKLLARDGDTYRLHLRLLKEKVITVVLNTEHEARYYRIGPKQVRSESVSTRIAEVERAGRPGEREKPPGEGHGFLWRLHSYWQFEERDGGVYVECEAISLTRNVPPGLGWVIEPVIRNLPRESLTNTLRATREALREK